MSGESNAITLPAWDNKCSEAARWWNTERPLTHSLDSTEEGIAMQATRPCSADGCDRPTYCKGLCTMHYQRQRNYGDLNRGKPTILDRLPDLVEVTPFGCWSWLGHKDPSGYGRCTITKYRTQLAHRVVYMALMDVPEDGLLPIDHLCRNTSCVNPDHLEPVTLSVNTQRGNAANVIRARHAAITHCPSGHEYTEENTLLNKAGARNCRTCRRAYLKAWKANRKAANS